MHIIEIIFKGFATGFALSLGLGTVFFALIQNSIKHGFKTGIAIASGVILSDMIFIAAALLGTSFFTKGDLGSIWIQVAAISLLLFLGIYTFVKADKQVVKKSEEISVISFGSIVYYFTKGFLLNILNPANFFAWAAISTYTSGTLGHSISQNILFFSFALLAIFITESLISFGAHKIKHKFTPKVVTLINRFTGIVYMVVAIFMIVGLFM